MTDRAGTHDGDDLLSFQVLAAPAAGAQPILHMGWQAVRRDPATGALFLRNRHHDLMRAVKQTCGAR